MSIPEKIGQLFVISSSSRLGKDETDALSDKVKSFHVGAIYITGGSPKSMVAFSSTLSKNTKVPLLLAIDAGTGLGDHLDSTMKFLKPLAIGAIRNDSLIYNLGETIARQMTLLGLHLNLRAVATFNDPLKEYEGIFSDDPDRAEKKSGALRLGLEANGILNADRSRPLTVHFLAGNDSIVFCDIPSLLKIPKKKRKKGETELLAILAGNDMLMFSDNINAATRLIQKTIKKNKILIAKIDVSVKKILSLKYESGLYLKSAIDPDNLLRKLNSPNDILLKHQLAEASVTVVRNSFSVVPLSDLQDKVFSSLSVGAPEKNEFTRYLGKYAGIENLAVVGLQDTTGLWEKLNKSDVIFVGIFPAAASFQGQLLPVLQKLSAKKQVIICHFGNPAGLKNFAGFPTLMAAWSDDPLVQKIAAQIIFGGMASSGQLPVTITSTLTSGIGETTALAGRLSYTLPEAAGMDSQTLDQIQAIATEAIDMKATPGMHVLVARNSKVICEKSFGYLTYDKKSPVTDETIYDLASVTKVAATLQTVMFMYEKGLIDINKKVSVYLPELKTSNKKDFTIKDILTHQAGLWPFLPFWAQTVRDTVPLPEYYSKTGSADYPYPVASNLYASRAMRDSLWHWIITAKIQEKTNRVPFDYKYSDMGFYIMQHLAERLLNQPMDEFLQQNIYEMLGASTTGFLPLLRFPASRIAPTEDDKVFRRSLLVGYVHDQGAAMSGGIAGHAGLFSTPNDLAKLGQMWLRKGTYGGHQFFKPETIDFFTKKQFENSRRGLGWDKPVVSDPNGPTSAYASPKTFGHTGFTGISIWVDPDFDLVFIFFSNRVYPSMTNNKILDANIRPRVQDVVYRSIFKYCANHN